MSEIASASGNADLWAIRPWWRRRLDGPIIAWSIFSLTGTHRQDLTVRQRVAMALRYYWRYK